MGTSYVHKKLVMGEKIRSKDGHEDISKEKRPLKPAGTELKSYLTGAKSVHGSTFGSSQLNTHTQNMRMAKNVWKNQDRGSSVNQKLV